MDREALERIGWQMAEGQIDDVAVRNVVAAATRLHIANVATAVLADTSAPYIVRCRAFGEVATELVAVGRATPRRVGAA